MVHWTQRKEEKIQEMLAALLVIPVITLKTKIMFELGKIQ